MKTNNLLYFPGYKAPAERLADKLACNISKIHVHHFPDGESLVRLPARLSGNVVIYTSLDHPDTKLVPLGLAASAARTFGADRVILVAPYLCYMRQDKSFHAGEAISQRIVGSWLDEWFDMVITVDAHIHRIKSIKEVLACGINISAAPLMAEFLAGQKGNPLLLGPDQESRQWVEQIAMAAGLEYGIAHKVRTGDHDVEITLPGISVKDRHVIIVDDVISSGYTVTEAAVMIRKEGALHIGCMVTHALFAEGAEKLLADAGVETIISADTILHASNAIFMAKELAVEIKKASF